MKKCVKYCCNIQQWFISDCLWHSLIWVVPEVFPKYFINDNHNTMLLETQSFTFFLTYHLALDTKSFTSFVLTEYFAFIRKIRQRTNHLSFSLVDSRCIDSGLRGWIRLIIVRHDWSDQYVKPIFNKVWSHGIVVPIEN